jgi:hypothetical protein
MMKLIIWARMKMSIVSNDEVLLQFAVYSVRTSDVTK